MFYYNKFKFKYKTFAWKKYYFLDIVQLHINLKKLNTNIISVMKTLIDYFCLWLLSIKTLNIEY